MSTTTSQVGEQSRASFTSSRANESFEGNSGGAKAPATSSPSKNSSFGDRVSAFFKDLMKPKDSAQRRKPEEANGLAALGHLESTVSTEVGGSSTGSSFAFGASGGAHVSSTAASVRVSQPTQPHRILPGSCLVRLVASPSMQVSCPLLHLSAQCASTRATSFVTMTQQRTPLRQNPDTRTPAPLSSRSGATPAQSPSKLLSDFVDEVCLRSEEEQRRQRIKHRVLDFYARYDPLRVPHEKHINALLDSGIPENLLFSQLQLRYGLLSTIPFSASSSPKGTGAAGSSHRLLVSEFSSPKRSTRERATSKIGRDKGGGPSGTVTASPPTSSFVDEEMNPQWTSVLQPFAPHSDYQPITWNTSTSTSRSGRFQHLHKVQDHSTEQCFTFGGRRAIINHATMEVELEDESDGDEAGRSIEREEFNNLDELLAMGLAPRLAKHQQSNRFARRPENEEHQMVPSSNSGKADVAALLFGGISDDDEFD